MPVPAVIDRVFRFDDPVWHAAAATGLAYLVAVAGLFVLLFVFPFLLW